jgi:zinc D-Ala-D-Ala carboxypeptidase
MLLSPHFTLRELTTTQVRGIDNTPPAPAVEHLRALCVTLLEPLRDRFGVILVTSGYRCPALNALIGGSRKSVHRFGLAADCHAWEPAVTVDEMARWVRDESGLPFDQVIAEASGTSRWLHLGLPRPGAEPRYQALRFCDGAYSILD